ncbi:hypothetical protein Ahy_B05g077084 [Arachis hypogaea]|uniref:Protein FAR1-RELATED SEQUENCE n=1 Tax=Arachis hypogaea TaxID=3818 RepID=A0A444Z4F5_ARAHY|nr:hypothetical protein Ahy_B05g077084 [Arachis hypogaea]
MTLYLYSKTFRDQLVNDNADNAVVLLSQCINTEIFVNLLLGCYDKYCFGISETIFGSKFLKSSYEIMFEQMIPSKLNGQKRHEKIEHELSYVVWNSFTKESFDRNWNDFLMMYGVGDNKYFLIFSKLFEVRHLWISVYLDHHFWAKIRSTQRSESMHAFFNKFITHNSSLIQFVIQYDNCLGSREQRENRMLQIFIPSYRHVYTHEKFRKVQEQFREKVNCIIRSTQSALGYMVSNSTFNKFVVTYDTISSEVKMSPRYILERLSKNVKRRYTHIKSSHDELLLEPRSMRFDDLLF